MGIRGFNREAASETGRHNQAEDKVRKEQVSLDTLGFGAAAEMFQAELEKLVFNIADPNTKPELKRNITLKLVVKPTEDRSMCAVEIHCDSKLAPVLPFESTMFVGVEHGVAVATEYSPQQQSLFSEPEPTPAAEQKPRVLSIAAGGSK